MQQSTVRRQADRDPPFLSLERVTKSFGDVEVLQELTAHIDSGEFISLIGPSGSGKTTTLRIVSGIELPSAGSVMVEGRDVTANPVHERGFAMVFQHFALFPHKDVFQNVAYGLQLRHVARSEIRTRVLEMLERVGMAEYANRRISEISGGQRQRVAIARALVIRPKLLLLDEPTGSLDAQLRLQMQVELKALHRDLGITFIHVTHNQSEALALADRVFVMHRGRVEQVGTPNEVFATPATRFVAEFVGRNNLIDGRVERGRFVSDVCSFDVFGSGDDGTCTAVVRSDAMRVGDGGEDRASADLGATLEALDYAGSVVTWYLRAGSVPLQLDVPADESARVGASIGQSYRIWWHTADVHFLGQGRSTEAMSSFETEGVS